MTKLHASVKDGRCFLADPAAVEPWKEVAENLSSFEFSSRWIMYELKKHDAMMYKPLLLLRKLACLAIYV